MRKAALSCVLLCLSLIVTSQTLEGKRVLWLGTSIPAGCTYPQNACANLGMTCLNHAIGESFVAERTFTVPARHSGFSLSMSMEEKDSAYRHLVEEGIIDKHQLDVWKFTSYDNRMLPFLQDVDIVIIDHGYNDAFTLKDESALDCVDWESEDRKTFVGAFNFIYRKIKETNPNVVIAIGGYFQNTCTFSYTVTGKHVSQVLTAIAEHYNLPLLDVWNYTGIEDGHIPDSEHYFDELNARYGTEFYNQFPDENGNITYFQKFCPDGVHPFSDPTGESDRMLDEIFTKLLAEKLSPLLGEGKVQEEPSSATAVYSASGSAVATPQKGLNIIRMSDGTVKKFFLR